ncbi:Cation/H+ exchanger [Mucor mucedo]|uniref:Cation/H+ exchanger n=1 Tax=Mucor mucedo TaxID=29922 RepID=UPI002220027B|nr:Cation/H+ exchanger [Mucor mucedo]KAI7883816.1 Cation/H+ exchanger [Mucor mucedo]
MDIDTTVSTVAAVLGGFILLYGVCSLVIKEKLYISEASVAILCGILCGPVGFNLINIDDWVYKEDVSRQFTRIVIAIQVMAAGVSLPKAYLQKEYKSLLILLGPVMVFMWVVSGLCVWYFIPGLTFLEALMIASCFTPTDPVLANSIVQGYFAEQHVPPNIRHLIVAESGANDGLGYPFLFLAIYLIQMATAGDAVLKWSWYIMGYEIGFSIFIGFAVGYVARKTLRFSEERNWIDKESFLVYAIALSLFLMGSVGLLGSDDLLACFIAGNSFTWDDWFRTETENAHLTEVIDMLLNLSIFVYIGLTMPWSAFNSLETNLTIWKLLGLAAAVLLFRRLPIILGLYKYIPAISNWRQAIFMGWFGPMGVGALFYYTIAIQFFETDGENAYARLVIEPIIYFIILSSVVIHGITIPIFFLGSFATRTLTKTNSKSSSLPNETSLCDESYVTYGTILPTNNLDTSKMDGA